MLLFCYSPSPFCWRWGCRWPSPSASAVAGALWIDLPLEALMIQITSGVNKFTLLAIPFFILAGAIMAEGVLPDGWLTSRTFLSALFAAGCRW